MTDFNSIPEILKTFFSNSDSVQALVMAGSHARVDYYKASPYSDMEIYIVVQDDQLKNIEDSLPDLAKKLGPYIFYYKNQWAGFSIVFENLSRLELPLVKLSDLPNIFSRPKAQTTKVLQDKTNGQLEKILSARPQTVNFEKQLQEKYLDYWYMAINAVQYYKKGELWNSRHVLGLLQSGLVKAFEYVDNKNVLLLETNKRIEQFISADHLKKLASICPNYDEQSIKQALKNSIQVFLDVTEEIQTKESVVFPKEIGIEISKKLNTMLDG